MQNLGQISVQINSTGMWRKPPATATPQYLWLPRQSSTLPVWAKNPVSEFAKAAVTPVPDRG